MPFVIFTSDIGTSVCYAVSFCFHNYSLFFSFFFKFLEEFPQPLLYVLYVCLCVCVRCPILDNNTNVHGMFKSLSKQFWKFDVFFSTPPEESYLTLTTRGKLARTPHKIIAAKQNCLSIPYNTFLHVVIRDKIKIVATLQFLLKTNLR